jgi:ankyrin repeat protein
MTALGYALVGDHRELVRALIEAGADPNRQVRSRDGETALHFAARRGDVEATRFLLAHGADPRIGSFSGVLPSELAPAAVQALLAAARPAPPDGPQSSGSTR